MLVVVLSILRPCCIGRRIFAFVAWLVIAAQTSSFSSAVQSHIETHAAPHIRLLGQWNHLPLRLHLGRAQEVVSCLQQARGVSMRQTSFHHIKNPRV